MNGGEVPPYKADDNEFVRRLLAAVMLVLFTSLNAMDGVCCPDGCTQEEQSPAQQHNSESADGICVLCLGGVDSSALQDLSPCGIVTDRVAVPPFAHHLDAPSDPVEHPPRS
jgi:hypothetical protein